MIEFSDLLKRPLEHYKYLLGTIETGIARMNHFLLHLDSVLIASSNEKHLSAFKEMGDFASFKDAVSKAAIGQFGSGWGWAFLSGGKLTIKGFPNQDNPISSGSAPIIGVDVWEHAYYLKYQNKRPDYVAAWWNTVNWAAVNERLEAAR